MCLFTFLYVYMSLNSCCTSSKPVNSGLVREWLQITQPTHLRVSSCSPSLSVSPLLSFSFYSSCLTYTHSPTHKHSNTMFQTGIEITSWNNALCCCFYYQQITNQCALHPFKHIMFPQESTLLCVCVCVYAVCACLLYLRGCESFLCINLL